MTPAGPSPSIADLFDAAATRGPEAPALIVTAERLRITYRDLAQLVDELARRLIQGGLVAGDRVGLRVPSSAEFVVGLLAASRAGLVVVPVDPALPVPDQRARMSAARARVVLVNGSGETGESALRCWPISVRAGSGIEDAGVDLDATSPLEPVTAAPAGLRPDDAMIMFTGGTTGSPKMVPWTHDNIACSVRDVIATYGLGPDDATVAVMPLFHGHGLIAALLATLASGGALLLPDRGRFSAHTFFDDLRSVGATWFTAVPTIHRIVLDRAAAEAGRERPPLRFVRSCSAALSPATAQELRTAFAAPVLGAYGMTEATHQMTSMKADPEEVEPGLVGVSSGVEISIIGDDGRPCPPGEVGEIRVRGRTVVRGYLGDQAATAETFTAGWLHTGDLGSLSATGELTLRGRIKEMINRGGEKISPQRIEDVLIGHPKVIEAAVFGVPDELYGETVAAVVLLDTAASPDPVVAELVELCRERLAAYEVPTKIQVAEELPHTAKGSVDRRAVANQFGKAG